MDAQVSFLIPTYNRSGLLVQCIESILTQTYKDVEIIVIDDGSEDDTGKVVNDRFNGRVRYYRNVVNQGVSRSRNLGLSYAKGRYIGLLDSDDMLFSSYCIETALKVFEAHPEICVFTSDAYCIDFNGRMAFEETFFQKTVDHRNIKLSSGFKDFEYLFLHGVHSCGAIVRKDVTKRFGFLNPGYQVTWDEDFFLRLSIDNPKAVYYHNEPLTAYRLHPGNLSKRASLLYLEKIRCRNDILQRDNILKEKLGRKAKKRMAEQYVCLLDAYLKEKNIVAFIAMIFKSALLYPCITPMLFKHGFNFLRKFIISLR